MRPGALGHALRNQQGQDWNPSLSESKALSLSTALCCLPWIQEGTMETGVVREAFLEEAGLKGELGRKGVLSSTTCEASLNFGMERTLDIT